MIATTGDTVKIYSITSSSVQKILPELIKLKIPLRRRRKDGSFRFVPLNDFDQFSKDKNMTFYLDLNSLKRLKQGIISLKNSSVEDWPLHEGHAQAGGPVKMEGAIENTPILDNVYSKEIDIIKSMTVENRVVEITENNQVFRLLIDGKKKATPENIAKAGDMFSRALCINKVTFEENLAEAVSHEQLTSIILETYKLVNHLIDKYKNGNLAWEDLAYMQHVKSGSVTLDHMVRLLMIFVPYLHFYNQYFINYSTEIKKIRAYFKESFYKYYNKVIRDTQQLNLEIVFKNGISPVRDRPTFIGYCMGCLLHDLGKYPEINYNSGSEGYDLDRDRRHVFDGFNIMSGSNKFRWNILSTMLLHHDYYGAPFGYRQLDTFRNKFTERRKKRREESNTKYLISYDILDVGYGNSYSYFPNKLLEIVDIYDSLTKQDVDKYSVMDALAVMKAKYIEGEHLGIDPILFNIFVDFLHACRIIINPMEIRQLKISKPG